MLGLIDHDKYKHLAEALEAALLNGSDEDGLPTNMHVEGLARTLTHRCRKGVTDRAKGGPRIHRVVGSVPSLYSGRVGSNPTSTLTTSTLTNSTDREDTSRTATILRTEQRQHNRRYVRSRPPDTKAMDRRQRNQRYEGNCAACGK